VPTLLLIALSGFAAQLVDGALGMAYGTTTTTLVLAAGLTPAAASASVHLAELGTCLASGAAHWRFGNVDWQIVRRLGVPGALGAFAGAVVLSSVSAELARPWMGGILLVLGLYILLRFAAGRAPRPRGRPYVRGRYLALLGAGAGFVDASGGGGWGPVATPTLLASGKVAPRRVIGSVDTSEFLVALAASVGFLLSLGRQGIDFAWVGVLLAGGIAAAPVAAWLVRKVSPRLLGASVGGLIVLTNARTIFEASGTAGSARAVAYVGIAVLWAVAVLAVVRAHRRAGVSLTSQEWIGSIAPARQTAGDG
jgi:uncharacterized membrane protein YfcA